MVREILKLKTDNGLGEANPTFKDIELSEYNYKSTRMGMPDFTATLMWPTYLDDEWTGREYVDFLGERHYIKDTPTSEKNNTDARIKHSLVFVSESASILGNVYFYDTVYNQSLTKDRVCSNSTKFTFYGTLFEVCDRINCSLRYRGIGDSILNTKTNLSTLDNPAGDGFCVMVDAAYTDDKTSWEFSAEDVSLWEIISNTYNTTEIPFERRGKKIIFGATPKVVSQTFRQGPNKELLSITHNNTNAKKINRITMIGASENIPHYYPNQTEYGNITVDATGNSLLTASKITIVNHSQFLAYIPKDKRAVLGKRDPYSQEIDIAGISTSFYNGEYENYALTLVLPHNYEPGAGERIPWNIKIDFSITQKTNYILSDLTGRIWTQDTAGDGESYSQSMIQGVMGLALRKGDKSYPAEKTESGIDLGVLDIGDYTLSFYIEIPNSSVLHITGSTAEKGINSFCFIDWIRIRAKDTVSDENGYYWAIGSKEYKTGQLGLSINAPLTDDMIGESIGWKVTERLPFQTNLMPPIYRSSNGEERFYEAIDNKYTDPDTGDKYIFPNPFVATHPCEHIYEDEKTKPTIKGITNSAGQLFGKLAAVAFDDNDNDSFKAELTEDSDKKDALKYEHSFFYVKLNKFDGTYGFNLFPHASQTGPMTIQMTSGKCNGCKFKIQVAETESSSGLKSVSNPVQTKDMNGDIVDGDYTEKVSKTNFQFWQQDTEEYSVWLCLQKDAETFGQILPSKVNGYVPEAGDTFNIINIDLPQAYIDAAEKRLEEDGIRYMFDHNEEKFNFNINASRIFFAENPDIFNELDEYSKLKIEYDGETYEQYVESLTISCVNAEPLPSVKIDLAEEITVGKNFVDSVAERASSLIANPTTSGGGFAVSRGGLNVALADTRYLNKRMADRSPYKIASDKGFESGNFVSGSQGGYFGINNEDGTSFIEVDRLRVRMKALFEEIEVAKLQSIGGEMGISPGGSVRISFVETLDDAYRCYFKGKDDDKGAECRFVVNDQVQCKETNIMAGKTQNATNRFYWRLVTAVNNDMSYFELSKNICSSADDDVPITGDTVMQLGNQSDATRQSAIVLSTNNIYAPNITLYNGIDSFTLKNKEVVQYGVDKTKNPPEPFFNCYGSFYFGTKDETYYLKYDASTGDLVFNGKLTVQSKIGDKTLETYINDAAQSAANAAKEELQAQIDGVIEAFNGEGAPTLNNYPANEWTTDAERKRHNKDVYTDITPYVDDVTTPTSGQFWRWYYNSPTDYGWTKIADSDAVRALQLAQMSVTDADVLYISHTSQTEAPALPTLNNQGNITNLNGWQTTAPAWSSTKYIWQTTYIKKGDGTATFSPPTCISGKNGVDGASAKIVVVNSDAAAFLYDENFSSLVGPQSINLTATLQGTSGYQWSYKRPGQSSFTNISGATSSAYSLAHNATIWGSGTTYKSITIRCTSGGMYDEITIVKVSSGTSGTDGADGYTVLLTNESHLFEGDDEKAVAGTTECGVVAYKGNIQIATTIGTISGMPVGMSVAVNNNGTTSAKFTVTVRTTLTTRQGVLDVPVTVDGHIFVLKFSWALSLKGKDGRGIVSVVEMYAVNNSNTNEPADTDFSTAVPVTSETHRYLWNYEKTTYTDNTHEDTDKRVIGVHGANGVDGAGISSIVNYYLASSQKNGITINTPGWTTDATTEGATTTDEKPYLWNYEKVYYTKGSPTTTTPHIIGIQGRGIKSIVEYYYLSTSNTTLQGGSWSETKQPWMAGRYYWTKSIITYTDGSTVETEPICVTGERGSDGVSAYLLNIKNNTAGVIANANGTVTGAYPSPQAEVWCGSQKLTTGITYSISVASGRATATINASGLVSLSGLLTDTATMTVTATINGVALQSTISAFKVKPGYDGTPATTYEIEPSQTVITKSMKNELSVTSLTCTVYKTTGDAARITSNEHTLKYTRLPDGANGTLSRTNGVSASVTVTDTTTSVIFELYNGTTLLDKETAYVVQDATDIELGTVNLLRETARILEHTDIWHKTVRVYTGIVDYYQGAQANRMSETFSPVQVYEDATPNEYYTFSAWVKVTEAVPRGAYIKLFQPVEPFNPYTGLNSQSVNINSHIILGEWVRVHGIFKAPDDGKLCVGLQIAKGAADSEVWIAGFKLEKGTLPSSWSLNPDDTLKFNYLAAALEEDTTIESGLIQTSLISLGRGGVMYAGSNGYYKDGTTPAFWAGGNMVDAAADGVTAADRPANFMVRMNGTGYASGNTIAFEKDKVRVGKDVIMDKDGFSITNDNAVDILQLSNKDIGTIDDITKSNTIMRRINGSTYNLSVNYGPEGFGLLFKDTIANTTSPYQQWQVGTVTKSETKFGMSLAFTLNLSNIDFNIPTSPWALYVYPNLKVQLMRSVSGNMVEEHSTSFPIKPTAHGSDVTIYADINYTIKTTGTYYLRLAFDITSTTSTNVADSTAYMPNTIVTLYTRTGKQTLMGNNGFATAWTDTLFYINENQVVLRAGSFSFRIHKNNGFGYNTDGSETYKPLNWR